jgi:hypothetical protein
MLCSKSDTDWLDLTNISNFYLTTEAAPASETLCLYIINQMTEDVV